MANPRRGEVEVELGGETHTLVFNFNAISEIEAAFGDRAIDDLFFRGSISRRAIVEALRAGLVKRHRRLTPKQVGELLDKTVDGSPEAYGLVLRAVLRGLMSANGISDEKVQELDEALEAAIEGDGAKDDKPGPTGESGATGEG